MAMMDAARGLGVAASGFQGSIFEVWTLDQRQVWLNFDLDFFGLGLQVKTERKDLKMKTLAVQINREQG